MAVYSGADEKISSAKSSIRDAVQCLIEAIELNDNCSGDQYSDEYVKILEKAHLRLRRLNRKL